MQISGIPRRTAESTGLRVALALALLPIGVWFVSCCHNVRHLGFKSDFFVIDDEGLQLDDIEMRVDGVSVPARRRDKRKWEGSFISHDTVTVSIIGIRGASRINLGSCRGRPPYADFFLVSLQGSGPIKCYGLTMKK